MWRDLRYAVAGLWHSPGFMFAAVAALGLAIGANATIFGLVDGLWFRPPGVDQASRLVWIFSTSPEQAQGTWSWPEYETLRDGTASFSGVVARGRRGAAVAAADGTAELLLVNVVSTNFFSTLGIRPALGRLFASGDESSLERQPVVVLGHALWVRRYGGDPAIVGRTIQLQRGGPVPVTVAAVLPETFRDLDADADRDLWMPPQTWMQLENRETFARRTDRWFDVLAVRRPDVRSAAAAQPEVQGIAARLARAFPEANAGRGARVQSHLAYRLESGGINAAALLGLVLLVVLITCVNVANLLLSRGAARAKEMAVRAALGATRTRLVRQLLVESLVLGSLGAIAGVTLALWLIRLLPSVLLPPPGFRSFTVFQADARVLVFTIVVTFVTTILFGLVPSWLAGRTDVLPLIKEGGADGRSRRERVLGPALVIGQVAISLVLLCTAALLSRSFTALRRADVGLPHAEVLTAWVAGDLTVSESAAGREALDRLAALPGVARAAVAFRAPLSLSGSGFAKTVFLDTHPLAPGEAAPSVKCNGVSRDYFDVLGTRLVAGRLFNAADEQPGEPVVVVNQAFAHRFFPGGNALGSTVRFDTPSAPLQRIVGIVQNAAIARLDETPEPYFYLPYWRGRYGEATYLVQTAVDAAGLAAPVRAALKATDPQLEPQRLITMRQYIDFWSSSYRATALLASALAAIGLLLTVLGVYGVVAYRTARRTREIGIRVALGATRGQVLRLVLREGVIVALAGVSLGLPLAFAGARTLGSFLYGVGAWDALVYGSAAVLLVGCVSAAALFPASRAARTAPSTALRRT